MEKSTKVISWREFDIMVESATAILSRKRYNRIGALTRGGLAFGVMLSQWKDN